jgi:hypothetical protein
MHDQTLYQNTNQALDLIKNTPILQTFYLAGGTSLALQLGHRKSVDLDFFIRHFPPKEELFTALAPFDYKTTQDAADTLDVSILSTKVSFLKYDYDLIDPFLTYRGLKLAGIRDIACMKLSSIMSRSEKKDYVDLYFILQNYTLSELLAFMQQKFSRINYSVALLLRSLNYFDEAESTPMPDLLIDVTWQQVKADIHDKVMAYLHKELD